MLSRIQMFLSIILAIILVLIVFGITILVFDKDPKLDSSNLPVLTEKEEKEIVPMIETQSLPMPGINE